MPSSWQRMKIITEDGYYYTLLRATPRSELLILLTQMAYYRYEHLSIL